MAKHALITGITGQDGSYLAELLLSKGYEVYGLVRRTSTVNYERIKHIQEQVNLITADILDQTSLTTALQQSEPEEVYNLAAQSFVPASWSQPVFTGDVTGLGVTRILDAIRAVNPKIRFYQAVPARCSARFRKFRSAKQRPFTRAVRMAWQRSMGTGSRSITAKATACTPTTVFYSITNRPAADCEFVTRKMTNTVARIKLGHQTHELHLGNLEAQARLGFCRRLCRRHVADAPAGNARRLRRRHGRNAQRTKTCGNCVQLRQV